MIIHANVSCAPGSYVVFVSHCLLAHLSGSLGKHILQQYCLSRWRLKPFVGLQKNVLLVCWSSTVCKSLLPTVRRPAACSCRVEYDCYVDLRFPENSATGVIFVRILDFNWSRSERRSAISEARLKSTILLKLEQLQVFSINEKT